MITEKHKKRAIKWCHKCGWRYVWIIDNAVWVSDDADKPRHYFGEVLDVSEYA